MVNSVGPYGMLCSAASHLGLHCLLKFVCPSIWYFYSLVRALMSKEGKADLTHGEDITDGKFYILIFCHFLSVLCSCTTRAI